ncbi:unnamed protein product [Nezara viridula]|uniref:N-acetyltransferase domain-containing protein n=1 Tax=Nezara viridula TaxID=85310 RepID=A0A9P0GXF3_NEZVI|nr:unnamed protein product [Nezara viridula]
MEFLQVCPIHKSKQFILECCDLINSEWPRSKAARLQSLYMSSDKFPTSLVLILDEQQVVGHVKLSEIKLGGDELMIETMIIHREHRGKGWGKLLMEEAEEYAQRSGFQTIYVILIFNLESNIQGDGTIKLMDHNTSWLQIKA